MLENADSRRSHGNETKWFLWFHGSILSKCIAEENVGSVSVEQTSYRYL